MILNKQYIVIKKPDGRQSYMSIGDIIVVTKFERSLYNDVGAVVIFLNDKEIPISEGYWCHFLVEDTPYYLAELDDKAIKEVSSILQEQSNQIMNRLIKLDAMLAIKDCD